jgi:CRP-like cAMP-binding protein
VSDVVAGSRFFAGIAASDVRAILARATPRRFKPNATMTHQGAPARDLFLVVKGRARFFSTTPDGKKMLLLWLAPGDIFGGAALLTEPSAYHVSSETVRDTRVLVWTRPAIRALAARYPRLLENALSSASDYLEWYLAAHTALSCHTARQRLARVLVSLVPVVGRAAPHGIELDVTNEELASAAHVTPFTTSRLLNEWQRHRTIVKRRGTVVLLAPTRLAALSS